LISSSVPNVQIGITNAFILTSLRYEKQEERGKKEEEEEEGI
jgi:hypothetical protein